MTGNDGSAELQEIARRLASWEIDSREIRRQLDTGFMLGGMDHGKVEQLLDDVWHLAEDLRQLAETIEDESDWLRDRLEGMR